LAEKINAKHIEGRAHPAPPPAITFAAERKSGKKMDLKCYRGRQLQTKQKKKKQQAEVVFTVSGDVLAGMPITNP